MTNIKKNITKVCIDRDKNIVAIMHRHDRKDKNLMKKMRQV
jgi:hypothetical protein